MGFSCLRRKETYESESLIMSRKCARICWWIIRLYCHSVVTYLLPLCTAAVFKSCNSHKNHPVENLGTTDPGEPLSPAHYAGETSTKGEIPPHLSRCNPVGQIHHGSLKKLFSPFALLCTCQSEWVGDLSFKFSAPNAGKDSNREGEELFWWQQARVRNKRSILWGILKVSKDWYYLILFGSFI